MGTVFLGLELMMLDFSRVDKCRFRLRDRQASHVRYSEEFHGRKHPLQTGVGISSWSLLTDSRICEVDISTGKDWRAASRLWNASSSNKLTARSTVSGTVSFSKEGLCRRNRFEGGSELVRVTEGIMGTGLLRLVFVILEFVRVDEDRFRF
jgi:hypothetical protein